MNIVDIISSTLIIISCFIGFFKGILKPFGYIFAFIVSFFFTLKNFLSFSKFLVRFIKVEGELLNLLSFILLLLLTLSLIILIISILVNILKKTPIILFDKIFGILIWGFVTFLIIGGILNFLTGLPVGEEFLNYIKKSFILTYYKTFVGLEIFKNVRRS